MAMNEAYFVENHPADSRVSLNASGICQTLTAGMGTGGGNVPMILEAVCMGHDERSAQFKPEVTDPIVQIVQSDYKAPPLVAYTMTHENDNEQRTNNL